MSVLFCNIPFFSVFKYNNILYIRTGTCTARKVCGGEMINFNNDTRVFIFRR